jgi:hypothetical protein
MLVEFLLKQMVLACFEHCGLGSCQDCAVYRVQLKVQKTRVLSVTQKASVNNLNIGKTVIETLGVKNVTSDFLAANSLYFATARTSR